MITPTRLKIMILGGGYIGLNLVKYLRPHHEIVLLRGSEYGDIDAFRVRLQHETPDCVINAFGFTGRPNVDECEKETELCWRLNVDLPLKLLEISNEWANCIHISSGCIYNQTHPTPGGIAFTEEDEPNFGLLDKSSFYSKSKHGFEALSRDMNSKILRIRMPICENLSHPRNYIHKILNYPKLIDGFNSKTWLDDLAGFILALLEKHPEKWKRQDIYNVVNHEPLTTFGVLRVLEGWKIATRAVPPIWVHEEDLGLAAPRSNCVLSNAKASKIYQFKKETDVLYSL